MRATIGIAVPHTQPPHYVRPNEDCFRHVAESYGDANPLWTDPEYAAKSVWGESIAPPALVGGDTLIGEDEVTTLSDEDRALTKGDPLRGVHAFTPLRRASGGRRCVPIIASSDATLWSRRWTRAANSPIGPSTSGRHRCSATTKASSWARSTAT